MRLPQHLDTFAAVLNGTRAVIAVRAAELFVVLAGWPGASFTLVQMAAVCALVSLRPNPTQASIAMLLGFPMAILVAAVCEFLILPGLSGRSPIRGGARDCSRRPRTCSRSRRAAPPPFAPPPALPRPPR